MTIFFTTPPDADRFFPMTFLKLYPPLLVAVATVTAVDGLAAFSPGEKWSIVGIALGAAFLLWKKLERVEEARAIAHREQISLQEKHNEKLEKLIADQTKAHDNVSASLRGVSEEFHQRPCVCGHLLKLLEKKVDEMGRKMTE
jgi:uncharacterized coiled-coil protein SlyX